MQIKNPGQLMSYFKLEKKTLLLVSWTGIIYNIGMTAGPFFEGRLAQCLYEIMQNQKSWRDMAKLAALYVLVILFVQVNRTLKRFYVRRFANNTSKNMRHMLYNSIVHTSKEELDRQQLGAVMTKAISDVDACVEGMRKFTTEIFDTGIVLVAYGVMLLIYDVRLALISCLFIPLAYIIAEKCKGFVSHYNEVYKKSADRLNQTTMDLVGNAITYRVFGLERKRAALYEKDLSAYETNAVKANIWESALQPMYHVIAMCGAVLIFYFGSRNVMGTGWTPWDIGAFTTFFSCFTKLALKSSKAAKLFNAVQKASVSWKRIQPMFQEYKTDEDEKQTEEVREMVWENVGISYSDRVGENAGIILKKQNEIDSRMQDSANNADKSSDIFINGTKNQDKEMQRILNIPQMKKNRKENQEKEIEENEYLEEKPDFEDRKENKKELIAGINLQTTAGQIIGITGAVASGKSAFGKVLIGEAGYIGNIRINGKEFRDLTEEERRAEIVYMGHEPELMSTSIAENILLGQEGQNHLSDDLRQVCLEDEVREMPEGMETEVGDGGVRLSGGQQARVALARCMYHAKDIMVLDDPFSAVDKNTEKQIFENLQKMSQDKIIFLISHRLQLFPQLDQVVFLHDHTAAVGTHEELMEKEAVYRELYESQQIKVLK